MTLSPIYSIKYMKIAFPKIKNILVEGRPNNNLYFVLGWSADGPSADGPSAHLKVAPLPPAPHKFRGSAIVCLVAWGLIIEVCLVV